MNSKKEVFFYKKGSLGAPFFLYDEALNDGHQILLCWIEGGDG